MTALGLALGGNKVRKLEYVLAAAQAAGADCVVCGGVVQSNVARQGAAACAKLGLQCHLGIMHGRVPGTECSYDVNGNILLDRLFGAVIHDTPWNEQRNAHLRAIEANLIAAGRRFYFVPYGASDALGRDGICALCGRAAAAMRCLGHRADPRRACIRQCGYSRRHRRHARGLGSSDALHRH